jgi:alkanesulfonate monooxygenase SsuD/methylene tetrahydromethanopterin reductase-like flavin-dependent oxidoreductase (luciferase family)
VAREAISLDHLSNGRLIMGVGVGGGAREFDQLGEARDAKVRAAMMEEGLHILGGLWSGEPFQFDGTHYHIQAAQFSPRPVQRPRIPIWVAGGWPTTAPFRRAARWDGVFPLDTRVGDIEMMPASEIEQMLTFMAPYRPPVHEGASGPFEVVHLGVTDGDDGERDRTKVAHYEAAGVTWWLENLMPLRWGGSWESWPVDEIRRRVRLGPPRGHASVASEPDQGDH